MLIGLTDIAAQKIKELMLQRDIYPQGLRVALKTKGCSGLSWNLEFIDEINQFDEVIELHNIKIYIDPKAVLFILGSVIDYKETDLEEGFIFSNPNEKGKCGCGESFTV